MNSGSRGGSDMDLRAIERLLVGQLLATTAALRAREGAAPREALLGDWLDVAQSVEHLGREHLNADRLADRARRLQAALDRVRAGEYGRCRECGRVIPGARLRVVPDAETCVPCQAKLEREGAPGEPPRSFRAESRRAPIRGATP